MTEEIITLNALLVKSYLLNVMHVRTALTPLHLQNDGAVPIEIENAFQKNWVTHLAMNIRKVGSSFPQRNPR